MENWLIIGVEKINDDIKKIHRSKTNKYDATIDALKVRKRIEYLKTDGCERIKCDYSKKKSERYWDDEIYHQRSAKRSRIMEEMKNVAETYKICEISETHTSQNISCMSF